MDLDVTGDGLVRMRSQPGHGLKSLLRFAKLDAKSTLVAMDIGYGLAPRINAAGRLGTAKMAVELVASALGARIL